MSAITVGSSTLRFRQGKWCLDNLELNVRAEQAGLTENETVALIESRACVPEQGVVAPELQASIHNGVPEGVECQIHKWYASLRCLDVVWLLALASARCLR